MTMSIAYGLEVRLFKTFLTLLSWELVCLMILRLLKGICHIEGMISNTELEPAARGFFFVQ